MILDTLCLWLVNHALDAHGPVPALAGATAGRPSLARARQTLRMSVASFHRVDEAVSDKRATPWEEPSPFLARRIVAAVENEPRGETGAAARWRFRPLAWVVGVSCVLVVGGAAVILSLPGVPGAGGGSSGTVVRADVAPSAAVSRALHELRQPAAAITSVFASPMMSEAQTVAMETRQAARSMIGHLPFVRD